MGYMAITLFGPFCGLVLCQLIGLYTYLPILCRNTSRFLTHDDDIGIDFGRANVNVNSKVKQSDRERVKFA